MVFLRLDWESTTNTPLQKNTMCVFLATTAWKLKKIPPSIIESKTLTCCYGTKAKSDPFRS